MNLLSNKFFSCFTPAGSAALSQAAKVVSYEDKQIIFKDEAQPDGVYLVLEGRVQLSKEIHGRGEVPIAIVEANDYFGEISVLDHKPRSAQASSVGKTTLAIIPEGIIQDLLKKEPVDSTFRLFERILKHLRTTNEKFAEEVLRKEKLHLIGEMAGMIIHDFKNPITAIQLSAEIIGTRHKDPPTHNKCKAIVQQSQRMVTMVQELLDFSRGNLSITTESVKISTLFEQFRELNQDIFQHSIIEVNMHPIDVQVEVNIQRIFRVFQNISMNAIEAMTSTNGRGTLNIAARESGSWIEMTIQDDGPGIPEHIRETIFQPFVTHGKKTGTGLGMAIAKMIVDAHRGELTFSSAPGNGTTFLIKLPKTTSAAE